MHVIHLLCDIISRSVYLPMRCDLVIVDGDQYYQHRLEDIFQDYNSAICLGKQDGTCCGNLILRTIRTFSGWNWSYTALRLLTDAIRYGLCLHFALCLLDASFLELLKMNDKITIFSTKQNNKSCSL